MKILLVGNYVNSRQESMQRLAELILVTLQTAGHQVRLVRPPALFGRVWPNEAGLGKWVGYIDRFILYPAVLHRQVRWADVVHLCDQANSVYIPYLSGKPSVLTCNDLLAIRSALGEIAESPTRWTGRVYQRWILRNLRKAKVIACISEHTREDVLRLAGMRCDLVTVVPLALNYPYESMSAEDATPHLQRLGIHHWPFLVHVGGNEWYKNRLGVIRIFAELLENTTFGSHRLMMVGKRWTDEMRRVVQRLGVETRVVELLGVSNEELRALYSAADALLFPSLQEGFGWPILEAQASNCVVITTNRPPMTDVSGGAAIFVDPSDAERAASEIVAKWSARDQMREAGLSNAASYSRDRMMAGYVDAYAAALAAGPAGDDS